MKFETLDWETAAQELAWAFGLEADCAFKATLPAKEAEDTRGDSYLPSIELRHLYGPNESDSLSIPGHGEIVLSCQYEIHVALTLFLLTQSSAPEVERKDEEITRDFRLAPIMSLFFRQWDGTTFAQLNDPAHAPIFAKGLARLGLLAPNVEAVLEISISAHERLEWMRQYQERYDL